MPRGRRLVPITDRRRGDVRIRWVQDPTRKAQESIQWASCQQSVEKAFADDPYVSTANGFYLSNSDLGLLGLAAAALAAPLAFAYVGPASAYYTFGNAILSSVGIGQGIIGALTAGALSGFIKPTEPTFTNFSKPCRDPNAALF